MAKKATYDRLFTDLAEAVALALPDKNEGGELARIILRSRPAIIGKYLAINNNVKAECMLSGLEKLDRHKCGACFMVAFEKRLIIQNGYEKYERYREKVAIVAAMTVLANFVEDEARRDGDCAMLDHIEKCGGLTIPSSLRDKKSYEEIWAMSLRRIYTDKQEIVATMSIANALFLIEKINKEMAQK